MENQRKSLRTRMNILGLAALATAALAILTSQGAKVAGGSQSLLGLGSGLFTLIFLAMQGAILVHIFRTWGALKELNATDTKEA